MVEDVEIEKINSKNFDIFFNLVKKLAEYEKQEPLDDTIKLRLKKDICSNQKIEAFLTKYEEKYVGYMILLFTYSSYIALPTLYIEDIFVLEEYRKGGIGQKMFDFCINKAKVSNCGRMEWCVYNWNKPAICFYKKNNATCLDKKYYRLTKEQIKDY